MTTMRVLDPAKLRVLVTGRPDAPTGVRLAPSPPRTRLGGHFDILRSDPLRNLLDVRERYGNLVRLQLGTLTAHLVGSAELARTVLHERSRFYDKQTRGTQNLRILLGNGLLTNDGESWLRRRRIAQPAFHRRGIEALGPTMTEEALRMVDGWRHDQVFDVHEAMMAATLRIVARTLLGSDVDGDEARVGRAVDFFAADFNHRLQAPYLPKPPWPTPMNLRFMAHLRTVDRIVRRIVRRRRADPREGTDLVGLLVRSVDEITGDRLDDDQLRDEVMTIFLAGHETTSNALSWALYLLSLHPTARRRLEQEVDAVLAGRPPTIDDLPKLAYTERVISEGLRLFPPAWMLARSPLADETLAGHHIPARSLVFVSPWVIHRNPEVWDDPEGFDPDRFAPGADEGRDRFAFFPFGGGPRICIGAGFAMQEAKLMLAAVVQRYRLDLVPGFRVVPETAVTLRPKHGIVMRAVERSRAEPSKNVS